MNRREFVRRAGFGAASLTAAAAGAAPATTGPATHPTTRPAGPFGPVLTNIAADSVTLLWGPGTSATGWVEFGETEQLGRRAGGSQGGLLPYGDRVVRVRLTGLTPGTKYFYRVHSTPVEYKTAYKIRRGADAAGELRSFTTLNPAAPTARFAVWNDTHEHTDTIRTLAVRTAADAPDADFLFWNGDVANQIDTEKEIPDKYLDPAAGPAYASHLPVLFGRGNHDVRGHSARDLARYVPGPDGQFYYWFRQGPVAFLVLDTGEDKADNSPPYAGLADYDNYREEQRGWLETVVKEEAFRSAPFRVLFAHIPLAWDGEIFPNWTKIYGDTGHRGWVCDDGLKRWGPLLDASRVDLVISGHTHRRAWFPGNSEHRWGQLIGGGPQLPVATLITGVADQDKLEMVVRLAATGEVVERQELGRRV